MLSSIRAVRGRLLPLLLAVVPVSLFSQQFIQSAQTPTFIRKFFNKFFRSITFKNVKIFYQNSVIITVTHVYVEASSATRQRGVRALGAHRIKQVREKR